jgi:hypothetical protein
MEFWAVHASGFLFLAWIHDWAPLKRLGIVAGLAAAYSAALLLVVRFVGTWWPLAVFWALMANRMLDAVLRGRPREAEFDLLTHAWAGTTALFAVAACLVGVAGPASGAVLIAGFAYFTANALSELTGWRWVFRWMQRARARAGRSGRRR